LDVPATGFALDIDLTHKAVDEIELKEKLKILIKGVNNDNAVELLAFADKLRARGIIAELSFEDTSDMESFAREKNCELIIEFEKGLKNIKIKDLKNNMTKIKTMTGFLKEMKDEKRN
jgi:histidyl-tRNA synthetase